MLAILLSMFTVLLGWKLVKALKEKRIETYYGENLSACFDKEPYSYIFYMLVFFVVFLTFTYLAYYEIRNIIGY